MKKILAIALALFMLLALTVSTAAADRKTATAVKTTGTITFDGKMTANEGWEKTSWIELTSKTNTTDTAKVKLLYDDDYLYFFVEVKNVLWVGSPNLDDPFNETGWMETLSASPISGDNFGFSILVDEYDDAAPRSLWCTADGAVGAGHKLEVTSTTYCNRYKYTWYQNDMDKPDSNLLNRCSHVNEDGHDAETCPYCLACPGGTKVLKASGFSDDVIAEAHGSKEVYVFRFDGQGGGGRYADANGREQEFRVDGYTLGINGIDEIRPMTLAVDEADNTIHRIEGRIHWITSANSAAVNSLNAVAIDESKTMGLEMKFGCGNDSWYFNCDPDGDYNTSDPTGVGFQIYKANTQWGKLAFSETATAEDPVQPDQPDDPGNDPSSPQTADFIAVASLVALASAAVVLTKKRK